MPMSEQLRALYIVREKLEHAHSNLQGDKARGAMRRWPHTLALMLKKLEEEIRVLEADEAEGRARRAREEQG